MFKKFYSIVMILCMTALLSGCGGNEFDAAGYLKGCLDAYRTGEVSEDLAANSSESKEELQEAIDDAYEEIEETVLNDTFGTEYVTDKTRKLAKEYAKSFFGAIKYDVSQDVEQKDDDYIVTVTVYPFKIDKFNSSMDDLNNEWSNKVASYTDQKKFMQDYYEAYIEAFVNFLNDKDALEYGEGKDIKVKITKDDDGYYEIDEDDAEKIFSAIYAG